MYVNHYFALNSRYVSRLHNFKAKFGYDGFGEIVFYRTYSRIKSDGGQESWHDVVIRVINGTMSIRKDWYIRNFVDWDEEYWQNYAYGMALSMFRMQWLPAGRGMWAMGTNFVFERGSMALNNCGYTVLGNSDRLGNDLHWMMDALMLGVGVGFEPVRDDLRLYSPIGTYYHYAADSREGWADSEKLMVEAFTQPNRRMPIFKYDHVRGPGLPIKGFGGLSSGPAPLKQLHDETRFMFELALRGGSVYNDPVRLKTDLGNKTGVCVVAGNVRRSAELCKGKVTDPIFMALKDYEQNPDREEWGYMSNNSVALSTDEDFESLGEVAKRVITRGEPGIMNLRNFKAGRVGKLIPVREDMATGLNPCFMSQSKVLTPKGIREIKDVDEGDTIWGNGGWTTISKKWSTGINEVFCYRTTAGAFYGTANHHIVSDGDKVEVQEAESIDIIRGERAFVSGSDSQDVMDGLILGDGSEYNNRIILYIGEDDADYFTSEVKHLICGKLENASATRYAVTSTISILPLVQDRSVPRDFLTGDARKVCGFLRGLFSANGSICGNRITLKASSFKVIEDVQMMLSSVGIKSYYTTNKPTIIKHHNGTFTSRESYDLNITEDRLRFRSAIGFIQKYKEQALDIMIASIKRSNQYQNTYPIISIESLGWEETWDITVDNSSHTLWSQCCHVSNCGEIPLEDKELCNVVETLPTVCGNVDQWYKACEYATFYASCVSLLPTHRSETNRVVMRNRRIGVSIIDWTGWVLAEGLHKVTKYMRKGYEIVTNTNRNRNFEAGVPEAIRKTTIKPGGTGPKLPGRTPGIGYPTFRETLRRMRVAANNPICPVLDKAGVPFELDYFDPERTRVYEYPMKQGPAAPADEISLWEQAMNLVTVQREWSDNAVSNTLYFRPKWKLIRFRSSSKIEELAQYIREAQDIADYKFHKAAAILNYAASDTNDVNTDSEVAKANHVIGKNGFIDTGFGPGDKFKLVLKENKYKTWELKFYKFDPNHEEDQIERVLSSITPLIKSCSLLPHSDEGAYRQMPEEGITPLEYETRLAKIKPIDWSLFKGSDGEDEKYCSGPVCVIPNT